MSNLTKEERISWFVSVASAGIQLIFPGFPEEIPEAVEALIEHLEKHENAAHVLDNSPCSLQEAFERIARSNAGSGRWIKSEELRCLALNAGWDTNASHKSQLTYILQVVRTLEGRKCPWLKTRMSSGPGWPAEIRLSWQDPQ